MGTLNGREIDCYLSVRRSFCMETIFIFEMKEYGKVFYLFLNELYYCTVYNISQRKNLIISFIQVIRAGTRKLSLELRA